MRADEFVISVVRFWIDLREGDRRLTRRCLHLWCFQQSLHQAPLSGGSSNRMTGFKCEEAPWMCHCYAMRIATSRRQCASWNGRAFHGRIHLPKLALCMQLYIVHGGNSIAKKHSASPTTCKRVSGAEPSLLVQRESSSEAFPPQGRAQPWWCQVLGLGCPSTV